MTAHPAFWGLFNFTVGRIETVYVRMMDGAPYLFEGWIST
jgi:hypothetical protein